MIAAILSLLGSSAVGSVIGGLFAFLNRKTDIEAKKLDHAHEKDKWEHDRQLRKDDLELARVEAQGAKDVAIIEGDALVGAAQLQAIAQVQAAERITAEDIKAAGGWGWLLVWASVFNRLIRPGLTVALAFAALYLNWILIDALLRIWPSLDRTQQYDAGMQAFAWVTAQASMAFGYWFVSRGSSK